MDVGNSLSDQGQIPCRKFVDGMADVFPAGSGRYHDEFVFIVIMQWIFKMGKCHERKGSVDIVDDFPPEDFHGSEGHAGFGSMTG